MRVIAFSAAAALAGTLAGCAFEHPSADAFNSAAPPQGYQQSVPLYFETRLKDPDSAKYQYGTPAKAYANNGLAYGGKVAWSGYALPVAVNAKNSYGGYTGYKPYVILFNGDTPVNDTSENNPLFNWFK